MGRREELAYVTLLALLEQVEVTSSIGRRAAQWLRSYSRLARQRLVGDALIAATAAERSDTLYIRTVRDFTRFYPNVQAY